LLGDADDEAVRRIGAGGEEEGGEAGGGEA
jgi:hypothetical protein